MMGGRWPCRYSIPCSVQGASQEAAGRLPLARQLAHPCFQRRELVQQAAVNSWHHPPAHLCDVQGHPQAARPVQRGGHAGVVASHAEQVEERAARAVLCNAGRRGEGGAGCECRRGLRGRAAAAGKQARGHGSRGGDRGADAPMTTAGGSSATPMKRATLGWRTSCISPPSRSSILRTRRVSLMAARRWSRHEQQMASQVQGRSMCGTAALRGTAARAAHRRSSRAAGRRWAGPEQHPAQPAA